MNPETNRFEKLIEDEMSKGTVEDPGGLTIPGLPALFRPNGKPVPKHWTVLTVGQNVVVENYTFKVAHIGESHVLLEPVGPVILGK